MKILYRNMLIFFAVIFAILSIVLFAFFHVSRQVVYQEAWNRLENYAKSIATQSLRVDPDGDLEIDPTSLVTTDRFLRDQHTNITIYQSPKTVIFPVRSYRFPIGQADWQRLKKGEIIRRKRDNGQRVKLNTRVVKKPALEDNLVNKVTQNVSGEMTDVFYPYRDRNGRLLAVIGVGTMVSNVEANFQQVQQNLIFILLVMGILSVTVSYVLAYLTTKRLDQMRIAARKVANGNFSVRLPVKNATGGSELDNLTQDFNKMVQSLKSSQEEITRQEERRKRFMADVAHEMRTPLTTINGLLEGLAYDAIPEESKGQSVELMRNETKRLIRLVNENLDYEKIRAGQIIMFKKTFDSVAVLKNIVEQLDQKAQEAGDHFELNLPSELPVYADYDRFIQVMFNIMQNAVQFTSNGKIYVSAERGYQQSIFRITDEGIGMTPDQVKNIWERYYKADLSRTNTKYGESGLGLAIVQELMQLHGGKVEVTSKPGKGSTFTIIFPDEKPVEQ